MCQERMQIDLCNLAVLLLLLDLYYMFKQGKAN